MIGIVVAAAGLVAATMITRIRYPRSSVVPLGKLVDDDRVESDLPCPWCEGPTNEDDVACPSCGQTFG
ncbi:MAG: hypothetical protein R3290_04200 [Acidimicrobiia bacterium]|nr:hypothetical protein [Acidimicrobiia bacterium]